MKKNIFGIVVIIMFILLSCTNDDSSNDTIKISGVVLSNTNTPEENVTVSIGDFHNLTTTTNSEGFFQIEGVAKGEHDLKIYKKKSETDADVNSCYEQWIKHKIDNNALVEGATYRLIFDYKADFTLPDNNSVSLIIRNSSDLNEWLFMDVDFFDDEEWRNNSFEFTLPSQFSRNNIDIDIHFCIAPTGSWWLDDISIERID